MADSRASLGAGGERRIEDYGLIGDCETAALVGSDGSIDWLCWPCFDSEACLAALLGDDSNGFWRIAPAGEIVRTERRYRGDTLILETRFETATGSACLIDLMPLRGQASDLVRIVVGERGTVDMRAELDLRFHYGRLRPLIRRRSARAVSALAGPHAVILRADCDIGLNDSTMLSEFSVNEDERVTFVLTYHPSHTEVPEAVSPESALAETEKFWSDWAAKCTYRGPHRDLVVRSLVTLKALTYRPTGGTVAAVTTSLPEKPGGERNWDYRFCWLRDAGFMLLAFVHAGYFEEAEAWRDWLLRAVAGEPCDVSPLYELHGGQSMVERTLPWLSGFNGAAPVRVGNAAHDQLQIDAFGEVIDAFHLARKHGLPELEESLHLQRNLVGVLAHRWREPDAGIWEIRASPRHFVHSKALAWAAIDHAVKDFAGEEREHWLALRDEIREEVLTRGFNPERNAFRRDYDSDELDASTLILPLIGLIDARDPKAVGNVEAIQKELTVDGLVLRYRSGEAVDGLPEGEGAFLACSFWLCDNLHLQGRHDEAADLFESLLGLCNDLGLLSEEIDPRSRTMLGNFPQALSHVGLVNTALNLSEATGPAEDRRSDGR